MIMGQWKSQIFVGDLHEAYQNGKMDIKDAAARVATRLEAVKRYQDDEDLRDLIARLKEDVYDVESYDDVLADLYDWANFEKRLWIDSFSRRDP